MYIANQNFIWRTALFPSPVLVDVPNNWDSSCHGHHSWLERHPFPASKCILFLVNKTKSRTEFQIYWYYDSTCFGQPFRPSSGVLRRTSALVHFMQFWWLFATSSILFLVANGHQNRIKCTNADVRLRTPDYGRKGCRNMYSRNTNKFGIQCICWFYSQGFFSRCTVIRSLKENILFILRDAYICIFPQMAHRRWYDTQTYLSVLEISHKSS